MTTSHTRTASSVVANHSCTTKPSTGLLSGLFLLTFATIALLTGRSTPSTHAFLPRAQQHRYPTLSHDDEFADLPGARSPPTPRPLGTSVRLSRDAPPQFSQIGYEHDTPRDVFTFSGETHSDVPTAVPLPPPGARVRLPIAQASHSAPRAPAQVAAG